MKVFLDEIVDSTERHSEILRQLFVVYDERNGNVVHVHHCLGDARFIADEDTHSRMALKMAKDAGEGKRLGVLKVPADLDIRGEVTLRVDIRSRQIKVSEAKQLTERNMKRKKIAVARKKSAPRKAVKKKRR